MTQRVIIRSAGYVSGQAPKAMAPGELAYNPADLSLIIGDFHGDPVALLTVRTFSPLASYAAGQAVFQGSTIYTAKAPITPGAFNPSQWWATTLDLPGTAAGALVNDGLGGLSWQPYASSGDIAGITAAYEAADAAVTTAFQAADTALQTQITAATARSVGFTATGTNLAGALAVSTAVCQITTTPAGSGIKLQSTIASGLCVTVFNDGANPLNVYPGASTNTMDALAAGAPYVLAAGANKGFMRITTTAWRSLS